MNDTECLAIVDTDRHELGDRIREARQRFYRLASAADPNARRRGLDWTVHQVIAHVLSVSLLPGAAASGPDNDQDRIADNLEAQLGTSPTNDDTDSDGLIDGVEYYDTHTDPKRPDTDGDGLDDQFEWAWGINPLKADTDGDGLSDGREVDELKSDPLNSNLRPIPKRTSEGPERADRDNDGLYDDDETDIYGTDPDVFDTDGDGVGDGQEREDGTL